jgi:hypothetical protein
MARYGAVDHTPYPTPSLPAPVLSLALMPCVPRPPPLTSISALASRFSPGASRGSYFLLSALPAVACPIMLRYFLSSLLFVEAASTLLAIIALVYLPCFRIWRATGYHL